MIIDRGKDWPKWAQEILDVFGDNFVYRDDASRVTTKVNDYLPCILTSLMIMQALNSYHGQVRDFEYITPKRTLMPKDLFDLSIYPQYLHIVASPERIPKVAEEISTLSKVQAPRMLYEPIPYSCKPENLQALYDILPVIYVLSPNHTEICQLFGKAETLAREVIETLGKTLLEKGVQEAVIVRCGESGACILGKEWNRARWVPAYHSSQDAVVELLALGMRSW